MEISPVIGDPATGNSFFHGNNKYVNKLKQTLETGGSTGILLLGPRRIGKTSVVRRYFELEQAKQKNIYIYIYLDPKLNLLSMYKYLIEKIEGEIVKSGILSRETAFKEAFRLCKDTLGKLSVTSIKIPNKLEVSFKDTDEWKSYRDEVAKVQKIFDKLLKDIIEKIGENVLVIALDELPEAIINFIEKNEDVGREEVSIWMDHFRRIRCESFHKKLKMILFGSINIKLTLERLKLSPTLNSCAEIIVKPMSKKNSKELFWLLSNSETYNYKKLDEYKTFINEYIDKSFGKSSAWAIQNFLHNLDYEDLKEALDEQKGIEEKQSTILEYFSSAYDALFKSIGGAGYLSERISKYYEGNIAIIKEILRHIVDSQQTSKFISEKDLFSKIKINEDEFKKIIRILEYDNMISSKNGTYFVENGVEYNYWTRELRSIGK